MLTLLVSSHVHPLASLPLRLPLQSPCRCCEHLLLPLGRTEPHCVTKAVAELALSLEQLGTDNLGTLVTRCTQEVIVGTLEASGSAERAVRVHCHLDLSSSRLGNIE